MTTMLNRRKAAAVVVAMGPDRAAKVLSNLDENEMASLATEVAALDAMAPQELAVILDEVAEEIVSRRIAARGGMRYAEDLLQRVLGVDRARELLESIDPANASRPFRYLASANSELVARVLAPEPPSCVALALAHLESDAAAKILVHLPPESAAEVAVRLASLETVHPDVVAEVDADFEQRLTPMLTQQVTSIPGLDALVSMLNATSREVSQELLSSIELEQPELAERIRDAMFVFEDIVRLDDRAIQQVLRSVDTRDLSYALKTASDEVRDRILKNLSERARENLVEEIEILRAVRASDVKEARTRIVRAVRALEEAGTITISRGGDDAS